MSVYSVASDIQSLADNLESLGATAKHLDEFAAISEHLNAFHDLEHLRSRAASFVAPSVDGVDLETRLATGEDVDDVELIDYAARATAANSKIGAAAQSLILKAQAPRVRNARDMLQGLLPTLIEDLRSTLTAAGDEPTPGLTRSLTQVLTSIDKLAGRDKCDYWCIRNSKTDKWAILARREAEEVERSNRAYAKEQAAQKVKDAEVVIGRLGSRQQPRLLSRRAAEVTGGFGGAPITAADIEAHRASKAAGGMGAQTR